jgi:hypothetical protein
MPNEGNDRVENIKRKLRADRKLISQLEGKTHASIKPLLQPSSDSLGYVETFLYFASQAEPGYVSMWLDAAETYLEIAAQQRKIVEDSIAKYGPNARAIY